ncbi:MAG: DUF6491 family protein [Steroidobacteraceae bacterium]
MKNTLLFAAIFAAAGIGIGASADASATSTRAGKNDCVWTRSINDFTALDRNKVVVWGPGRRAYLVELSMPLPELKFAYRLAFVDRNHDGMLCGFGMDRIVVADSSAAFRTPSTILGMTRLDDAGIAQLEEQYDVRLSRKKKAAPQAGSVQPQPEGAQQPVSNPEND